MNNPNSVEDKGVADAAPRPVLDLKDAVALVVGIVIGAGIFKLDRKSTRLNSSH